MIRREVQSGAMPKKGGRLEVKSEKILVEKNH